MKILHVETGRHLYGGPQQVLYLMKGLTDTTVVRCDQAPWTLFGVSLAGFNFLLSLLLAGMCGVSYLRAMECRP